MGNGVGKLSVCFTGVGPTADELWRRSNDDDLGHSFCYIRPELGQLSSSFKVYSDPGTTSFKSISGAAISANASTPLSTACHSNNSTVDRASTFEGSTSFSSIPLQPIPRNSSIHLFSGPMERGFMSGPLDKASYQFQRSYSHGGFSFRRRSIKLSFLRALRRAFSKGITRGQNSIVTPIKATKENEFTVNSSECSLDDDEPPEYHLQWAQGKAGEDRVHVLVSEERGWVFVGIYDGFNGPDAPDYLLSNLYPAVHNELKGLLWDDETTSLIRNSISIDPTERGDPKSETRPQNSSSISDRKKKTKWEENHQWDRRLNANRSSSDDGSAINHSEILKALSQALKNTEEAYLNIADQMVMENPELALMGSCVLVMLMKGKDVYVMNVGDSRAVLAQNKEPDMDLERINEETMNNNDLEALDDGNVLPSLTALQLTMDHSTSIQEEVMRIKAEHCDDSCAVINDRVKSSLKVTRAFGAGFLKQPKWNDALLEMF